MPYGDGTGPMGWQRYNCRGRGFPRGRGGTFRRGGFGGGFGWRRGFWGDIPQAEAAFAEDRQREVEWLEAQAERLQDALQRINERLEALKQE